MRRRGGAADFAPAGEGLKMTEEIYKNCASPKTKLIVKGAGHGESYYKDTEGYERAMDSFIGGIIK